MDTIGQFVTAVQNDLTVSTTSSLISPQTIRNYLSRVYLVVTGLHPWSETEDAQKTSTQAGIAYYDYPTSWRPDSIWKITVDGIDLGDPLVFKDYLYETENDFPTGEKTIWSNQWRRYFIQIDGVAPASTGNKNISIWGNKVVGFTDINDNSETTIFSYSMPELNEALVMEVVARFKKKGGVDQSALLVSAQAKGIIDGTWLKIAKSQDKYKKNLPMLNVPDFFSRGVNSVKDKIGQF